MTAREPADKRRSPASVYNTVKANPYTAPPLKEKISLSLKKERTKEEKQKVHKNPKNKKNSSTKKKEKKGSRIFTGIKAQKGDRRIAQKKESMTVGKSKKKFQPRANSNQHRQKPFSTQSNK